MELRITDFYWKLKQWRQEFAANVRFWVTVHSVFSNRVCQNGYGIATLTFVWLDYIISYGIKGKSNSGSRWKSCASPLLSQPDTGCFFQERSDLRQPGNSEVMGSFVVMAKFLFCCHTCERKRGGDPVSSWDSLVLHRRRVWNIRQAWRIIT